MFRSHRGRFHHRKHNMALGILVHFSCMWLDPRLRMVLLARDVCTGDPAAEEGIFNQTDREQGAIHRVRKSRSFHRESYAICLGPAIQASLHAAYYPGTRDLLGLRLRAHVSCGRYISITVDLTGLLQRIRRYRRSELHLTCSWLCMSQTLSPPTPSLLDKTNHQL